MYNYEDEDYMDFGKRRVGRPRGRKGVRKMRKSVMVKGRKRKIYRGKNGALYYRSRSGKVYLSARKMRKMSMRRKARKGRKVRKGRKSRKLKMTKSAIAARRAYRRRKARMSFFGAF
jgi:hypothetical protein